MSTFTHAISTNNYGPAKFIVSASSSNGTHTTIASAIAAATSGDTIFIRSGTYTENLTMKAGVNITAFTGDSSLNYSALLLSFNVKIIGKLSFSSTGTVNISNICLQTNSDYLLSVTGSSDSEVCITDCYINISNNTGIEYTSSGASSIVINNSVGDVGSTGITIYTHSSTGDLVFNYCTFTNGGLSTTASNNSSSSSSWIKSRCDLPLSASSTGFIVGQYLDARAGFFNATSVTLSGTGSSNFKFCILGGGTSPACSVGAGTTLNLICCEVNSSNTNAITGAGTINYGEINFSGSSKLINTTTQQAFNSSAFTPVLQFGGASVGITYSRQVGYFSRIDNIVYIDIDCVLTSKGSSTGNATITGIPFSAWNNTLTSNLFMTTLTATPPANTTGYELQIAASTTSGAIFSLQAAASGSTQLTNAHFGNATVFRVQGFYFI